MARYTEAVCKLCRREGTKLFLKGDRCYSKCPIDKPTGAQIPGQHGKRRTKLTEYGKRLREKQKTKRMAGLMEKQFFRYFDKARTIHGTTGENLLRFLEVRLDSVVRKLGFSTSINGARQLVSHGHIQINGKRVDIPSYQVKNGDTITLSDKVKGNMFVQRSISGAMSRGIPTWLELGSETLEAIGKAKELPIDLGSVKVQGQVKFIPKRDEMAFPVNEQYIVELYSK